MTIELTTEQSNLLQNILVHLIESNDWQIKGNNDLLEAHVLMDYDKDLALKIDEIYNKLF